MIDFQKIKTRWATPLLSPNLIKQFQIEYPYNEYSLLIKSFLYDTERDLIEDEYKHLELWILISEIITASYRLN